MTRWLPRLESATIRPPAGMSGAASWARRRSGRALVESTQSHCFADSSRPSLSTPEAALLTRMSSRPATRSTSAINRLISAGSFRSAGTRWATPPRSSTSRAVLEAASRFTKKFTKTRAPVSAKRSAMARPMPRPPPVTRISRGACSLISGSRRLAGRALELAREGAKALGLAPGLRLRQRRLERVLERRRRHPLAIDRRAGVERPRAVGPAPLAPDRQPIAGADRTMERDAREPVEPAHCREIVTHPHQELGGLRERFDDERSREDGVAREMIGEHVLGGAHVLQRLDGSPKLGADDAIDEHKAHASGRRPQRIARRRLPRTPQVPGARRPAAASWPTMYSVTARTVRRFMMTSTASGECRFFSR